MKTIGTMVVAALLAAGMATAGTEDDLAVVKKAVTSPTATRRAPRAQPAVTAEATAVAPAAPRAIHEVQGASQAAPVARTGGDPRWFKVRILEKGEKHGRVTINLPLNVVRALGDDWPIELCNHHRHDDDCPNLKLSEVLRSLDTGQSLVEIDDDEATVRVWVE